MPLTGSGRYSGGFCHYRHLKGEGGEQSHAPTSFGLCHPYFLSVTVGCWGVKGSPEIMKLSLLAFTAEILLTVSVEEMLTETHEKPEPKWAALCLPGGFALFTLLTVYLGE